MSKKHNYTAVIKWTGNKGNGTTDYKSYERSHSISVKNKATIMASSDPAFRGDKEKHNPEDLFLSSLASCHMLWYLHFCATAGVVVLDYVDEATGIMEEEVGGKGKFTLVTLNPKVVVADLSMKEKAIKLHHKANEYCFIANSCNFSILHKPVITVLGE
ncbi:OsmC family protein [Joostella sp.]|uniref:OsmC family protein n=1 Tax=Joostella sp. TaxID=2231138 RepID=UPI003A904ACD